MYRKRSAVPGLSLLFCTIGIAAALHVVGREGVRAQASPPNPR